MGIPRFGLPLLTREILEQASRRSTYIFRSLVAAGITTVALIVLFEQWWRVRHYQNPFALLGSGRYLLEATVYTLFTGIYGLLPLVSCGAVSEERERNSLDLLLLTKLGPWTIIFEKILSRLVLMTTLLLLSLPVLGFAYSLGGVDERLLVGGIWLLFLASFHVIALSIFASTVCKNTIAAYLLTCAVGLFIMLGPILLEEFGLMRIRHEEMMFPPAIYDGLGWSGGFSFGNILGISLPLTLVSLGTVALSRFFLTRPVPLSGGRAKLLLTKLDAVVCWALSRVGRSPHTLSSARPLPVERPLVWKETFSGILSNARHRRYVITGVTLFVLLGCWWAASEGPHADEELALVYFTTTGLIAMSVVARSATLFSHERSRQTLEILLVTPMTNRQLLRDKFGGINRRIAIFAVPLVVLFVCDGLIKEFIWSSSRHSRWSRGGYEFSFWLYLLSQVTTVWIYLQMLAWLSVLVGLKVRKPIASLVTSLAAILAWAILPIVVTVLYFEFFRIGRTDFSMMFLLSSPLPYLLLNQFGDLREMAAPPLVLFVLNSLIYGGAMLGLRVLCFRKVGKLLQREDSSHIL